MPRLTTRQVAIRINRSIIDGHFQYRQGRFRVRPVLDDSELDFDVMMTLVQFENDMIQASFEALADEHLAQTDAFEDMFDDGTFPSFVRSAFRRLTAILNTRYIYRGPYGKQVGDAEWVLRALNLTRRKFRTAFRMSLESFMSLHTQLLFHPVYQQSGNKPQRQVTFQMLVALFVIGHGSSLDVVALTFEIATGTVFNYLRRFVRAVLSLERRYIDYPRPLSQAYARTTALHLKEYGLPDCLGFVDGSIIPLYRKPDEDGDNYHNRKQCYALNATAIVDATTKIIFYSLGHTGGSHDSAVLNDSDFYLHPEWFFQDDAGYILGDSAYKLTNRVIKPFLKHELTPNRDPEGIRRKFNLVHSRARVCVEHVFGIIKCRFQILNNLTVAIIDARGNQRAVDLILAAFILHNYLLRERDIWDPTREELERIHEIERRARDAQEQDEDEDRPDRSQNAEGAAKRNYLIQFLIENNWWEDTDTESDSDFDGDEDELESEL